MFEPKDNTIPENNFILDRWQKSGYRATAIAYMQQEKLDTVKHLNGKWYSLSQLQSATINGLQPIVLTEKEKRYVQRLKHQLLTDTGHFMTENRKSEDELAKLALKHKTTATLLLASV